ncbi:MAG: DUF1428 domain-containing protein [Parvularculaceae bacterium]
MTYVDVFVIPVPEKNLDAYKEMSALSAKVWIDHGALAYRETVADDVPEGKTTDFFRAVKREDGETVVVGYAVYASRQDRDEIMKKVMADPRLKEHMSGASMPFDGKRMFWGGFKSIVEL